MSMWTWCFLNGTSDLYYDILYSIMLWSVLLYCFSPNQGTWCRLTLVRPVSVISQDSSPRIFVSLIDTVRRLANLYRAKYITCKNVVIIPFFHMGAVCNVLNYIIDYMQVPPEVRKVQQVPLNWTKLKHNILWPYLCHVTSTGVLAMLLLLLLLL